MLKFDEWYLPNGEKHLPAHMGAIGRRVDGRLTYQYGKYEEALKHVKQRRVAIDIGAHVGLWTWFMARDFDQVAAFEPMPEHQQCWNENMKLRTNAELFKLALGPQNGHVCLETRTDGSSGDTQVAVNATDKTVKNVQMMKLDDLNLHAFGDIDFLKVDCEGFELDILRGAEMLLSTCQPCVVVEQKHDHILKYGYERLAAVRYLERLGAKVRMEISGDWIMSW